MQTLKPDHLNLFAPRPPTQTLRLNFSLDVGHYRGNIVILDVGQCKGNIVILDVGRYRGNIVILGVGGIGVIYRANIVGIM